MNKAIFILFFILTFGLLSNGQDIHFSQFYTMPIHLNPALTGHTSCLIRAGMDYRSQYSSVTVPYVTQAAYVDGKIKLKALKGDWFGLGAMIYNDRCGDGSLMSTRATVAISYNKGLIKSNSLFTSLGISISYVNKSLAAGALIFNSQWNGYSFDPAIPSGEPITAAGMTYIDINAGILINYISKFNPYLGISLSHINGPKESFYGLGHSLGRKLIVHGGMVKPLSDKLEIKPEFMAAIQRTASEGMLGLNLSYRYHDIYLYIGVWSRLVKDVIPVGGLGLKTLKILFSYDLNLSTLTPASTLNGGFEISLTKTFLCGGKKKKKDGVKGAVECPSFH